MHIIAFEKESINCKTDDLRNVKIFLNGHFRENISNINFDKQKERLNG